jgi:predicted permease
MVLAVLGGFLGVAVAWVGVRLLPVLSPEGLPRAWEIGLDGTVLLFTAAVSVLTGLVFGLAPLVRIKRADLASSLRDESRGSTGGRRQQRIRSILVVSEMAVALVLLIGAGILIRSFQAIQAVDLKVATEGVLTYEVHLPEARYPTGADRVRFYQEAFPRISALPGVEAVGATSWLPVQGRYHSWGVALLGDGEGEAQYVGADMRMIEGDYFDALDVDLVRGRLLGPEDVAAADSVTVINEALAQLLFGEEEAVGRVVLAAGTPRRVVGIVEDVPHDAFGTLSPKAYIPHPQFADNRNWALIQTVSFQGSAANVQRAIREELRAMDPNLVLFRPRTMDQLLGASLGSQRFSLVLMGAFAVMALALAALGIYGVLSYLVSQRGHEIGIRMALGAQGAHVRRMVIGRAMAMAGAGTVIGLALAFYLSRWLESMVFEVDVVDPLVFGGVALGLTATAWLAAFPSGVEGWGKGVGVPIRMTFCLLLPW